MSKKLPNTTTHRKEHGTTASYIVGFALSLVFTAIPYYMVVNKTVSGTALLAAIVGFAILQMLIQIFFFLHLGRGPKPLYNVVFFASTVGIILVVVGGSIFIMNHLHYSMTPKDVTTRLAQDEGIDQVGGAKTGACADIGTNHKVVIKAGKASPLHTDAHLCDTLSFVNEDNTARDIAFGKYPNHDIYGGEIKLTLSKGYSKTITLNQASSQLFYDHTDPTMNGSFTVTP